MPNQLVGQIDTDITKDEFKGIAQFQESDPSTLQIITATVQLLYSQKTVMQI